jgi:chaperonin GroEL (HSP60 family)
MIQNRELLECVGRTSLGTKLNAELAEKLTSAVVDAIQCIYVPDEPLDLNRVETMSMEKNMGTDSRFVNGLVLDHGGRHPDMPKVLRNCHIMTCNVTFEYEKTEVQSGFFYSNAEEREKLVESERKWLDERCRAVIDFKRRVCKDDEVRCLRDAMSCCRGFVSLIHALANVSLRTVVCLDQSEGGGSTLPGHFCQGRNSLLASSQASQHGTPDTCLRWFAHSFRRRLGAGNAWLGR